MKTKILVACFLMLFISEISFAQVTFQKTYGGLSMEIGYSIEQTTDGGYIITGSTFTFDYDNGDVYLIRLDSLGNLLWSKAFGDFGADWGTSVHQTADGGFIVCGYTESFGVGFRSFYLIRTDSNGNLIWSKVLGAGDEQSYCVQQNTDGGFIIAGISAGDDAYIMKTDSIGGLLWAKSFGGTNTDGASQVRQTSDGGFIIAGSTESFGAGAADVYVIKIGSGGNLLWSKTFGGGGNDYGSSVEQVPGGGYIVTGTTSFGAGNSDVYLIRTDSIGDTLWTKTFGGTDYDFGYYVKQTMDGGYIISGETRSFGAGWFDVYLVKTDSNGVMIWTKTFGGTGEDRGYFGLQTLDGGYIVTGSTQNFGAGNKDIYVIKTDSNGYNGCNEGIPVTLETSPATLVSIPATMSSSSSPSNYAVPTIAGSGSTVTTLCTSVGVSPLSFGEGLGVRFFPNPFHSSTTLTVNNNLFNDNLTLSIFNVEGKILRQQKLTSHRTVIERNGMADGLYFYKLAENGIVKSVGKLLIK